MIFNTICQWQIFCTRLYTMGVGRVNVHLTPLLDLRLLFIQSLYPILTYFPPVYPTLEILYILNSEVVWWIMTLTTQVDWTRGQWNMSVKNFKLQLVNTRWTTYCKGMFSKYAKFVDVYVESLLIHIFLQKFVFTFS